MIGVIGAGVIGLSTAWRLAQRGLAVTVMNHGRRGGEASPAGAGMLAPGGEFVGRSVWTDLGLESHAMYGDYVRELTAESGCPIDYNVCGAVELAYSDEDWHNVRERARIQASNGIASFETAGGICYPNDGYVDPRHVLGALRSACSRRGVVIQDGHTVETLEAMDYDAAVVAAGAWSGEVVLRHGGTVLDLPRTIPIKGHLIGYRLPPGSLGPIRRRGHHYLLQRANGFTIAGSNEERAGFDTTVNEGTCREIHAHATQLWPELKDHVAVERWMGFRPACEDMLPRIGRFEDTNVWLAYGHYRNGILLAPVTAQKIAGEITSSLGTG